MRVMKTDSTVELIDESRILFRGMTAGKEGLPDVATTWGRVKEASWSSYGTSVEELRVKLVAARKAVIGGGNAPVWTVFWPEAGVPTGGEPLPVEKLEAAKAPRAEGDLGWPVIGTLEVVLGEGHTETLPIVKHEAHGIQFGDAAYGVAGALEETREGGDGWYDEFATEVLCAIDEDDGAKVVKGEAQGFAWSYVPKTLTGWTEVTS